MADAPSLHLLRRATYGPTPAAVDEITRLGPDAWLERQLRPASIPDPVSDAVVRRFGRASWSAARIREEYADRVGDWAPMIEVGRATVARAIWSERQLFEMMVEFWSNHLNVTCPSGDVWSTRSSYDQVIRRHAMGSFTDLLVAATLHPAMLLYLDNASSTKEHPNENHGRELLELHTVGVDAGYGEDGVRDSARILTGLGVDEDDEFVFRPDDHDTDPVSVLGFSHANGSAAQGRAVAEQYLRYLASHPSTARRIAYKLAVRFVSDSPPGTLVDALAKTYLRSGTAILPVLRELFGSVAFRAAADSDEHRKVRRPYEDVVATVRTLGLRPDAKGTAGVEALHWMLLDMGHAPLAWAPPNGYPDVALAWQSAAGSLARWNAHLDIAARWWPKTLTGPKLTSLLPARLPRTHGHLLDQLSLRLVQRKLSAKQKRAVCVLLTDEWNDITPDSVLTSRSAAVGWRLPYLVALILDSPQHALR